MCLALDVVNIEFWTRLKIDKTVITLLMHSYERLEQGIRNSNFIRNVKMVVTQWYFNVFITLLWHDFMVPCQQVVFSVASIWSMAP